MNYDNFNYIHETNSEFNCYNCDGNVDDWELKCIDCGEIEQIYLDCIHCDESINICEFNDICDIFIININIIKKWFKSIKKNAILWKIAEYYTKKKYSPQSKFMIEYFNSSK
jgi:hypothetical protein